VGRREGGEASVDSLPESEELVTDRGTVTQLWRDGDSQVLRVSDAGGRLLFRLDEPSGKVTMTVPEGDLELRAERGRVRIHGSEGIDLDGPIIVIRAPRLRQVVGVLETRATRVVEKAQEVYRDAEGLYQVRARDVRQVAKRTFRALGERLRLKAKKDAKLKGDKIYLG